MLVEDEDAIVRPLLAALGRQGYAIDRFRTAEEAIAAIGERPPDLVIMDIGLPGMSGLDACLVIRERWPIPILVLSARDEAEDRILGLELGADDYLAKPFSARELVARVRALLRRRRWRSEPHAFRVGELELDADRREVRVDGAPIDLTPREFDLLEYLMARSPAVVTRGELIAEIWDRNWDRPQQTLDVHIAQLRRKLEADPHRPRHLHTLRGVGYQVRDACAEA
jgi:two-component system response regulator RegX3